MNASDLQPFCCLPNDRPSLAKPFSRKEFTYATDGRLIVRVPRLPDVGEDGGVHLENIESVSSISGRPAFKIDDIERWEPVPNFPISTYKEVCGDCFLTRRVKDTCGVCHGDGVVTGWDFDCTAVKIGHRHFGPALLFNLMRLSGLQFAPDIGGLEEPINFRFDGGCGALMPLRITDPSRSRIFPPQ